MHIWATLLAPRFRWSRGRPIRLGPPMLT